jgi:hypothetical protein
VKRNRPVSIALVGLFAWQIGCSTGSAHGDWEAIEPPYEAALEGRPVHEVRLSVADSVVRLRDPSIVGDSIRGEWKPYYERAVALDQVESMEAAIGLENPANTVVVVVVGAALVTGIVVLASCVESGQFGPHWKC